MAVTVDGKNISEVSVDLADVSRWTVDGDVVWENKPTLFNITSAYCDITNASYSGNVVYLANKLFGDPYNNAIHGISGTLNVTFLASKKINENVKIKVNIKPFVWFTASGASSDDPAYTITATVGKSSGKFFTYENINAGWPLSEQSYEESLIFNEGVGIMSIPISAIVTAITNGYGYISIGKNTHATIEFTFI